MNLAELTALNTNTYHEPSLRLLADCLPQLVWSCNDEGVCDFVNRRGLEYSGLLGLRPGSSWLDLVSREERLRVVAEWHASRQAALAFHTECRLRRHDGDYRWFEVQAVVQPSGELACKWLVSASDIQEAMDYRQLLEASHRELRNVFDEAPIAISLEDWRSVVNAVNNLRDAGIDDLRTYFYSHPEFVEQMIDSVIMVDTNKVSLSLFRAERHAQLVGRPMRWLFDSADGRQRFIGLLCMFGNGGTRTPITRETDLTAFDGTPVRVLSYARERQPHIEPGMVLVSRFEVTELRRADLQLAEQRTVLERMSTLAKIGGWVYDVESGAGRWTREWMQIHGIEADQPLTSEASMTVFSQADHALIQQAHRNAIEQAQPFDLELPLTTPSQQHKWVRTQGLPIVRDGKVVRIEGAVQDITDRKLAELEVIKLNATLEQQVKERTEQWQRANHDLQSILDALPIMVGYWDRDLRLQFFNRAYQEGLGLRAQDMHGKHFTEVMQEPAMHADRLPRLYLALSGQSQRFEAFWNHPNHGQQRRRMQIHYQPDVVDGEVRGIYVLVIDLSSLQQVEDALRAANRELDAFAYAVAHDLRAPLRAMNGFSSALLEDCAATLDADARQHAQEINKASRRMGELLDGLLVLSRSTQGDMQFNRIDMTALTQALAEELQRNEPQRQVEWRVAPDMVAYGDARMIEAALRNLLGNAWKYTGRTAQPVIGVDTLSADGIVQFRISDNGAGFDMAHADRLFKPFQRLHRQDEFIGIGVGLATVKRIVQRHGGEIRAEATPGQGARFTFHLNSRAPGQQP